jgi:chromate reductase, NAD(P)H dehydrogenase (quinone)
MAKVLAFAGSLRAGSWNKKLVRVAAQGATEAGADVTILDLKEYPLAIYDGDDEASGGLPENALKLKEIFKAHAGFIISCPEYNSGYSAALKNMIDWVSRPMKGEKSLEHFRDKPAVIMAASPGIRGGLRMLPSLRVLLSNIGVLVLPQQHGFGNADTAFDENGNIKDEKLAQTIKELGRAVAVMTAKLS